MFSRTLSSVQKRSRALPVAVGALCALAFLPAAARADLNRASDLDVTATVLVQQDLNIAAQYWNVSPTAVAAANKCASYTVEVGALENAPPAIAEASQPGCWLRIAPETWTTFQPASPELLQDCAIIVHEFGHSTGQPHSADPNNVMYPSVSIDSVPGCNAAFAAQSTKNREAIAAAQLASEEAAAAVAEAKRINAERAAEIKRAADNRHYAMTHRHHKAAKKHKAAKHHKPAKKHQPAKKHKV